MPGSTVAPLRSTTRVAGPRRASTSSSDPTATMTPPATATAVGTAAGTTVANGPSFAVHEIGACTSAERSTRSTGSRRADGEDAVILEG